MFMVSSIRLLNPGCASYAGNAVDDKSGYEALTEEILGSLQTYPHQISAARAQRWVCLVRAKVSFLAFFCIAECHHWAKKAFEFLPIKRSGQAEVASKSASRLIEVENLHVSAEFVLPMIEATLLLAEVHEHNGHLDSCLTYLSEAVALTRAPSHCNERDVVIPTLSNLVSLHALRIWFRIASPKFQSCLDDIVMVEDLNRSTSKGATSAVMNECSYPPSLTLFVFSLSPSLIHSLSSR
jgi:hypothetical protein